MFYNFCQSINFYWEHYIIYVEFSYIYEKINFQHKRLIYIIDLTVSRENEMSPNSIDITPSVTVHELLEIYPELEDVLIGIAKPFKKLKNPFLRRTIAKVATIKHISSVGGVPLDELIGKLREAVGQPVSMESYDDQDYFSEQPDWFSSDKVSLSIDEAKVEDNDRMTLVIILNEAKNVKKGEIIELITSFLPAPGIDILKSKGYSVWTHKVNDNLIKSYFLKNKD